MNNGYYEVEIPDGDGRWMRMVKCRQACPVHTDACGYVTAIAEGRYEDAYRIARANNPFASICGRVCGAPCEVNCRRGALDAPVAIRALKRFVTDSFGPETGDYRRWLEACDERMLPPNRGDYEKVAVVGAGVSGLTVAHDLARLGYKVTVFEAHSEPGGMLVAGVPVFRLPRDLVRHEINAILSLGVELKCNVQFGRDFSLGDLRRAGFRAIFLGVGLPKGRKLPIPGAGAPNVYDAMEFLRAFNSGNPLPLGRRIVVIGGGNVAYDVARSALRPEHPATRGEAIAEMERGEQLAYDVARSAVRAGGGREVHVVCLERRDQMPADELEVREGEEEGVRLHNERGPKEILTRAGAAVAVRTVRCTSLFDTAGRFNPSFDDSDVEEIPADTIVFAIGQASELSFLDASDGVEVERGLIKVNPETYQTTAPDVFACGDVAHGPRLFIDAVASAHVAARSVHDFLRRTRTDVVARKQWRPASYTMAEGWYRLPRRNPPVLDSRRRVSSLEIVEARYPEAAARQQASRCLRCNINTVFDTSNCLACNGCVDICPENLIRLVGLSRLVADDRWAQLVSSQLGVTEAGFKALSKPELDALGAVMLKDETTCIRCALCASRCPTHAITMQEFEFHLECVTDPSPNPKIQYQREPVCLH